MIGKVLLCVFSVFFLLLLIASRIPAYIRVQYEQGKLQLFVKYAWLTIPLFQKKEKEPPQETVAEKSYDGAQQEKEPKQKNRINRDQILYTIDKLPSVLLKALKRFGRRIRIEPLKVHILVATPDPADTAILYGRIQTVLAATLPTAHRFVKIREQDIQLFTDFCEEDMDFIVDAGIGIPPGDILNIAFCALGGLLKWFAGFKKRATKGLNAKDNSRDTTAQAENAA